MCFKNGDIGVSKHLQHQQNNTFVVHAWDAEYKFCTEVANYVTIQIKVKQFMLERFSMIDAKGRMY